MNELSGEEERLPVEMTERGVQLRNLDEAYRFASAVARSGLAPKGLDTPEKILVALQAGAELGLSPMRSLASIIVINGRPSITGDAAKAIVRASGVLKPGTDISEGVAGKGENRHGWVKSWRVGTGKSVSHRFSVTDAKQAKLWSKPGPWQEYPDRMMKYRALGFHLRDQYGDVLMGLRTSAEVQDMPPEAQRVIDVVEPDAPDPLLAEAEETPVRP